MSARLTRYYLLFLGILPLLSAAQDNDDLQFVQNKGQFENTVLFRAQLNTGYVYLERNAITFKLFNEKEYHEAHRHVHEDIIDKNAAIHGHVFKYKFKNCFENTRVNGRHPFFQKFNYFLGNDPSKWASNVALYPEVIYTNIYDGIDLKVYSKYGQVKYEWIVAPGADVSQIEMELEGLDSASVANNALLLHTSIGTFPDKNLEVWQSKSQLTKVDLKTVRCNYVVDNNTVSYRFPEGYNSDLELVIDPILIFSTYSGSRGDNFGYTATFDLRGNLYAGGITDNSHGEYPVTTGAFQTVCKGGDERAPVNLACDITISKYDSSGKKLLYATYIGGTDDEYPHSMVVNNDSELVVFGTAYSKDFPMHTNGYDITHNSAVGPYTDIVVFKLSKNGDALLGSTFFGGSKHDGLTDDVLKYNYADDFRGEVLTDKANNIYVVSNTNSANIPLKNATKSSLEGLSDGLCLKFSKNLDQLLWSTYFGGDKSDAIYSMEFDKDENIYVAGGTLSKNLPVHSAAFSKINSGERDGFLAAFNKNTFALDKATYYGTGTYDQIFFLEIDKNGNVYATGQTAGNITPTPGAYTFTPNSGQFVIIMDAGLSKINTQTVFGSRANNPNFSPSAFLVDSCGNIYISGWGSDIGRGHSGSTLGLPITTNATQKTTDGNDFYIAVFGSNLSGLLYATYFGGYRTTDHVDGGTSRFDKRGVIYQSVCSSCPDTAGKTINDFPTTPGSVFPVNVSYRCSNAAFKIDLKMSNFVLAKFIPDSILCGPADIQFTNQSNGKKYYWNFGDSKTSEEKNPKHSYPDVGIYQIQLIAIDSNKCNIADTSFRTVNVVKRTYAIFEIKQFECTSNVEIKNNSRDFETSYWNFGDSSESILNEPGVYEYKLPGTYKIKLIVNADKLCPDTADIDVEIKGTPVDIVKPVNVFTPDGDGLNDCFHFDGGLNECTEFKITIYNRWGQKMFETDNFYECWNGSVNNGKKECTEGTYFYICEYKGDSQKVKPLFSGTVTLIRK